MQIHKHIIHHTKKAIYHSKKMLHHGAKIAHKHRHVLLSYAHIFLVFIALGYYNLSGNMFAQEIQDIPPQEIIVSQNTDNTITTEVVEPIITENLDSVQIIQESSPENLSGEIIPEILSGEILSGEIIPEILSGEILSGEILSGESLSGEILSGEILSGEILSGESLSGESLSGESLSGESLSGEILNIVQTFGQNVSSGITVIPEITGLIINSNNLDELENFQILFTGNEYVLTGELIKNKILEDKYTVFLTYSSGENEKFNTINLNRNTYSQEIFFINSGIIYIASDQKDSIITSGYISEISIYDRYLEQTEVDQISKDLTEKYLNFDSQSFWEKIKNKIKLKSEIPVEIIQELSPEIPESSSGNIELSPEISESSSGNIELSPEISESSSGNIELSPEIPESSSEIISSDNLDILNYFDRAYKLNDIDEKIVILQKLLNKIGLYVYNFTNIYDTNTLDSVYQFQKQENILAGQEDNVKLQGYLGPNTRKALNGLLITNPDVFENSNNISDVQIIQELSPEIPVSLSPEIPVSLSPEIPEGLTGDLILESTNTISGQTAEIYIPEGTIFENSSGSEYTGEITAPIFTDTKIADELDNLEILSTIKIGPNEPINLTDLSGNQINATFTIPTPGLQAGDIIVVNYSQDGETRYHLDNIETTSISGETYAVFQANHFTIFSLGIWTGSFMINNDAAATTGLSVTLNSVITGATHMKFGNTAAERDSASWIVFTGNYNRTLTGADGEKTVYAIFSGNGTTKTIQDTIFLDTSSTAEKSGLQLHLDGSYLGTRFYDLSSNNYFASGINGVSNTTRSGLQTMGFNGTNRYINTATGIVTAYPFTISARVKPDRVTGTQGIVFRGNSTVANSYYGINLNTTTFQITARNTVNRTANGTIAAQAGKRYHVVGVFSSAKSRTIYVNGVQGGSSTNSVTLSNTSPHRTVGKYAGTTTNYFSGNIDEVRVYNKALTSSEIQALFIKKPSFTTITKYIANPDLEGQAPDTYMSISAVISGNTYPAINNQNGTRTIKDLNPVLASGTYNVILNYTNIYGGTGSTTYTNGLIIRPLRSFIYTPNTNTFGNVIATLTGYNTGYFITNNNGSNNYTFTGNNSFSFAIQDLTGNQYTATAKVDWIKKGQLTYSTGIFNEDPILNNGKITDTITVNLTGDTFSGNIITGNLISLSNVPTGLTGIFTLSGTTTVIVGLTGTATNHADINDISNLIITFKTGSFTIWTPNDIIDSTKTGFIVNFLDPYVGLQLYPTADTMLDADTNPDDGCADGVCQENNYGAMDYLCTSDFGSKVLLKFNLASIPTGSIITSAKLRLTKYYIGALTPGTGFKLKQLINNGNWIEGTQNNAKALTGEVNYKMRKRQQESWYNGNIGLVAGVDYKTNDLISNPIFSGSLTANVTQEFDLNSNGLATIQDWHDDSSTNEGFVISDSDKDWLCIYAKENATIGNRPLLTINYAPNTSIPEIISLNPVNNTTGVSLGNNLIITFDEKIKAYAGYTITIKRLINNSIFETIGATSGNVTINGSQVTINPTNNLENFTGYYVEIQSGAFRDYAGNAFTGFIGSGTWKFTTINTLSIPVITGNTASNISENSAIVNATLTKTGSSAITERGFYRSTTNGFNDGDGTKVSEVGSRTDIGSFSGTITGLPAGTNIYFKGFAKNDAGVGYTLQSGFITKPAKPTILAASNIDNDTLKINWSAVTGASTYKLYVTNNSGWTTTLTGYNPKLLSGSITSQSLTGLTRETTYYYKLIASNIAGDSIQSDTGSATTLILPAPTAWLKFEETAGNTAYDSTPNNNNGVIYGGTIMNQSGADGRSFRFNGTTSDVSILDFNYGPSFTVSFWFKTPSTGNNIHLYSHGDDSAANSINIILDASTQTLRTYINGSQTILNLNGSTYATMTNNQWHYYVVTVENDGIVPGKKNVIVYLDGIQKISDASVASGSFDPINNITIGRRSANQTGTYFSGYIDDVRIYDKRILSWDVSRIFTDIYSNIDIIAPTASISYNPGSGTCYSGNVIATLTGYSENITITNNSGSNQYTFTNNGSFTFEFMDIAENTGTATATVNRICKEPLSIGGPTMISSGLIVSDTLQIIQQRFPDDFRINDPIGADSGYYTTISITNLSGTYGDISNSNVSFKANAITLLTGTTNPRVVLSSGSTNYQTLNNPITYIKRDPAANSYIRGKYGDTPRLQIQIQPYQVIDNYHATINYTIYEN